VFRPGFVGKVRRTSVVKHYGVRTLLYGTLLPGPDIGRRAADVMQGVRDAGHETGVHCWDHIRWQDGLAAADAQWTLDEMRRACDRFTDIMREPPHTHGAAGWQMNVHALRFTQRLGFDYCSDGRGTHPYLPVWNAELVRCPQFPTTLPTLDEMVGIDGVTEDNVAAHLLERTRDTAMGNQVFTLHAELEGMRLAPAFEQLLVGWKAQGWTLGPTRMLYEAVEPMALPRCETGPGSIAGRTGTLLVQGPEFLGEVALA
jgi:peptidoglycan/xylan/chitin deacetylase (PgdA/CDA1 family)